MKEAKLHLAKPNKQIISHISEKTRDSANIKLGNINELSFSIPHYIDYEYNPHVDLIKEKMLIRFTLGAYQEWYVVDEIEEDGDDSDWFNVKAFSLGYELKGKRVYQFKEDAINATEALTKLLKPTIWTIGTIDPLFDEMFRSFDIEVSNVLDCIVQLGETYGALIEWDTINRKISLKNMTTHGRFRGMTVDYGRFLQSIKRTRTTDEMVTRLWIYGKDGLSINSVNPTGAHYIENFDFFMYPFERDENRNVIRSSYFMSDELCHAILDHQIIVDQNAPLITSLYEEQAPLITEYVTMESQLLGLQSELAIIEELLDIAKASENEELIEQRTEERNAKESQITAFQLEMGAVKGQIDTLQAQIDSLQSAISNDPNFTKELLDELNIYIIESEWTDDRYEDARELYQDGLRKFEEIRQPKVVIDVTIDNLFNILEEQYYWDKIVLGDLIKVKYPQMNIEYMAKIIEITYDFSEGNISIVIANTTDLLNETEKLVQLLYGSSSTSTIVQNNKYKWDKVNAVAQEVNQIITQEWNANKNKIIAGVNNSIEVGRRGILITNPDFPNEMVIMQSGIIALSEDGGETWKTAIKPTGIVAERLIGRIIAGQELLITNSAGTFTIDDNGVIIEADSFIVRSSSGSQQVNLRDVWMGTSDFVNAFVDDNVLTAYEKKMLKIEWEKLKAQYESTVIKINGYYSNGGADIPEITQFHNQYTRVFDLFFTDIQTDGYAILDPNNMENTTRIERAVFDSVIENYESYKLKVDEILTLRAKQLADDAHDIAEEARQNIEEIENDIVWKIELTSSKGFTFKNGIIDTVISAKVYRGKDDVTATLPNSSFIWKKYDKDGILDTAWTQAHVGVGNVISVTSADVHQKAIFSCDVDIEE